MQETKIQIEKGFNDQAVTIHHPETVALTFATVEMIRNAFRKGENQGMIRQPAYNDFQKEPQQIEWFQSNLPGARRIDNYGWTVINGVKFDSFKDRYDKKVFGARNNAPANFRLITAEEFASYPALNSYPVTATKYAQLHSSNDGVKLTRPVHCRMYLNDLGNGYAIETVQTPAQVNWYRFELCRHEDERTKTGKCYEEFTCRKCGRVQGIDSSD